MGISRETWDKTVERYKMAPYSEYYKSRGDEALFLSNYISAVRLSDESTYLIHPRFLTQFDQRREVIEVTEKIFSEYQDRLVFKDSDTIALINWNLMELFDREQCKIKDEEKLQRLESLLSVAKESFYDKIREVFQTRPSGLPLPHKPEAPQQPIRV